jgi:hypothetical protein
MVEQEKRELHSTCCTEQQGVLQKATGGVAQSDTNETKLKKPNNETNPTTDVVGDTSDFGVTKVFSRNNFKPSSRQVEVVEPGLAAPIKQDRVRVAEINNNIPPDEPVPKKAEESG